MKTSRLIPAVAAFLLPGITAPAQQSAQPQTKQSTPPQTQQSTQPLTEQSTQPQTNQTQPQPPVQKVPHRTLANGAKIIANALKVTLKEPAARVRSLDAQGKSQRVSVDSLKALHPDITSIKGGHTCSRNWLEGKAIPGHLIRADGKIPRIARNFNVILRDGADAVAVRAALQQHADVERVDMKYVERLHSTPSDSLYGRQWAPAITGLETAWDVPGRGPVRVAVIDTGLRLSHPEFAGRVVFHEGYADLETGEAPASGEDFDHGTHVAGIIAATRNNGTEGVAGYSNDIQLMILNCATWDSDENEWRIGNGDDAIDDAVANGASVINCSFGFSDFILGFGMEDEVEDAYEVGVLVVHSAGNDSENISDHWESGSSALLTISATMTDGATPPTESFDSSYSNFGPGIDFAAPGTAIASTIPYISNPPASPPALPNGYGFKDGTSMAAPQVAGAAALMMTMNPNGMFNHLAVRDLLYRMAEDRGPAGWDQQYGFGVLRLKKSVYQACRDADAFVSSYSTTAQSGAYATPWRTIQAAVDNVPNGGTLMLNAGTTSAATYNYPGGITITKPCTLSAIPDKSVVIGGP